MLQLRQFFWLLLLMTASLSRSALLADKCKQKCLVVLSFYRIFVGPKGSPKITFVLLSRICLSLFASWLSSSSSTQWTHHKWDGGVKIWRYFRKKNRYRLLLCSLSYYAWTDVNRDSVFVEPDNCLWSKCKLDEALATVPLSKKTWLKWVFFKKAI